MKIYVDFDDCLCETARYFSELIKGLFGMNIPYEDIRYFNLQKSFSLTDMDYEIMMLEAHKPEELLSYQATPGASGVIQSWIAEGHEVSIITGRPYSAYEASREWLDTHGFAGIKLYCFNKYGRDNFIKNSDFSLELEDYYKMHFDLAIEDSPRAFKFFDHLPNLNVLVFDRPWNRECVFPNSNYSRCYDWEGIKQRISEKNT